MLRTIFNRKVHDYKTDSILTGTREEADKVRIRPAGRLTASDLSMEFRQPQFRGATLNKTITRNSLPELENFKSFQNLEALVPDIQRKDFVALIQNKESLVDNNEIEKLDKSEALTALWLSAYIEEINRVESFYL